MSCKVFLWLVSTIVTIQYEGFVEASSISPTESSRKKDVVTKWELISSLLGMQYKATNPKMEEPQPLLVIGANFGRTGTQSFVEAMRRLNIKCYHFKDGVYETPGHFEIWNDIIDTHTAATAIDDKNKRQHQQEKRNRSFDRLVQKIAEDGFNATSDMPAFVLYKEFFDVYPNARVVVTVRPPPNASRGFATSFQNCILPIYHSAQDVPFRYFRIFQIFVKMLEWALEKYGVQLSNNSKNNETTKLSNLHEDLAVAHDKWIENVKLTIPEEQLLIFSYSDGWEPLCDFLSPIEPSIQSMCEQIIESGELYPYLNDSSAMTAVIAFLRLITLTTKCIPFFVVVYGCTIMLSRYSNNTKDQQKAD